MKRLLALVAVATLTTCAGSDGGFKDALTFGTGVNGMELAGEATAFDSVGGAANLWFRFESKANFSGRFVRLYFNTLTQKDYASCASADAHICLSQVRLDKGTWQVKGYLVKTNLDIGEETLVATSSITVQ